MMRPFILFSNDNQDSASQSGAKPPLGSRSTVLQGKRVVIVEDEGITQMQLRSILKRAGLVVLASAVDGVEGVATTLRERPDLVLMDICMPGPFDGLEAARRILAEYHVCIVMLTAFSDAEYRKRAEELKVCGYVIKPITMESLVPQLEAAVQNFRPH